jgi:hypothetical protein
MSDKRKAALDQRRCSRNAVGAVIDIVKRNRESPYFSLLIRRVFTPSQS